MIKNTLNIAKERIDPRTTGGRWKKIRNISFYVASGLGLILLAPINLSADAVLWIQWGAGLASLIAGGTNMDRSNKKAK